MHFPIGSLGIALGALALGAAPALAQSFPFSRAVDAGSAPLLAVETARGRVEVITGDGPMTVGGTVVVRLGWNVPADALARARAVAASPPIEVNGADVRLTRPADSRDRDAVIIHWRVRVPSTTRVAVRTESGEVRLAGLAAPAVVHSGAGVVTVHDGRGGTSIDGQSGAIDLARLAGDVRLKTGSGAVRIAMTGAGAVDATTRSSAIEIEGARSGLRATSGSGAIRAAGAPGADWLVETRSSHITILPGRGDYRLDLRSRSGRIASDRPGDTSGEHDLVNDRGVGARITARSGSGGIDLRTHGPS